VICSSVSLSNCSSTGPRSSSSSSSSSHAGDSLVGSCRWDHTKNALWKELEASRSRSKKQNEKVLCPRTVFIVQIAPLVLLLFRLRLVL